MVTISHVVKKLVRQRPLLYEAIAQDIVSFAALADHLKHDIETELGSEAKHPAIIMALRRFSEQVKPLEQKKIPFRFNSEIIMKTGLADITCVRTLAILNKLKHIYDLVDYEKGETLNVIHGNYELTIVISERHTKRLLKLLEGEKVLNIEHNLVSLTMSFSKDFLYTPGILAKVTRKLHWEAVNVFENISTMTELIYIVEKKDAVRAYTALTDLIEEVDTEQEEDGS
ncbi:MAG: hypothetical protein ABIC95_02255 [archaeon]